MPQTFPNPVFTPADVWHGGTYELALEIGNTSDHHLRQALAALWSYGKLSGCYLDRNIEPANQQRVPPVLVDYVQYYGIAHFPNGAVCACGSVVVRFAETSTDWLHFYLPMGALSQVYPVNAFPFDGRPLTDWQHDLDAWLAELAQHVWNRAPFRFGLVGFDLSNDVSSANIARDGIPAKRDEGYLWPSKGQLQYFPATTSDPAT